VGARRGRRRHGAGAKAGRHSPEHLVGRFNAHQRQCSNETGWCPPPEIECRYVVQDVADFHAQDPAWFKPLYAQMHGGGLEAMPFQLLHRDLGDWHPRQIIRTAALAAS
jgi:hypothetical protein